jgi:PadR family transcriptional regulator, regulatory protein PadR
MWCNPTRITESLLDVLELLIEATRQGQELHGWALMKGTKRPGPTVYGVLDRLEDIGWITGRSEERNPEPGRPPRRFYRLTPEGTVGAQQVLATRRAKQMSARRRSQRIGLVHVVLQGLGLGGVE